MFKFRFKAMNKIGLIYFILSTFCGAVFGLYEDQIGKFDWNQKYIGKLQYSGFDITSPVKKVIVSTHENVLAALSLKSGDIIWRQVFPADNTGKIEHLYVNSKVVTVHGSNPYIVRGWNVDSGYLSFEWTVNLESSSENKWIITDQNVIKISVKDSEYIVYGLNSGNLIRQDTMPSQFHNSINCVSVGLYYICLSRDRHVHYLKFSNELNNIEIKSKLLTEIDGNCEKIESVGSSVQLSCNNKKYILILSPEVKIKLVDNSENTFHMLHTIDGKEILLSCSLDKDILNINATDLETNTSVMYLSDRVDLTEKLDGLDSASIVCHQRKDKVVTCRLLVSGTDNSLMLIQHPGKVLWRREESLASITSVIMLDLSVSDTDAAIEKEFNNKEAGIIGMFLRRLISQAYQLQGLVFTVLGLSGPPSARENEGLIRDEFGLHKLIIAATSPGKIFGIDNLTGKVIWSFKESGVRPFDEQSLKTKSHYPLFVMRSTRHFPYPPVCGVLVKDADDNGQLITFNPITGSVVGNVKFGYRVKQVTTLHQLDEEFVRGLVVLDCEDRVHVYPESSVKLAASLAHSMFIYVADGVASTIEGFSLSASDGGLMATKVWNLNLGQNGDRIVTIVGKNRNEKVHSQGRVLSDRSVLYKYVNPNLVAVVTEGSHPVHKTVLSIYLLDVVSGAVVFSIMHRRAREPYHVVHSENWLLYTYFNDKYRRTELTTLEMYEGKTQSNASAFSSVSTSSFQPIVERQSYIFPANVLALKETITEKGITSKHILVGLTSGGIVELPWILVDPRRPVHVTPEMREEGVIPYMPELPIPLEAIINYNQSLVNIRDIYTSSSDLESTCLVFVYGLDLFYTRVAPSKTFDLLKDDFDYFLITTVLICLTAVSYLTRKLSSKKALKQAWK